MPLSLPFNFLAVLYSSTVVYYVFFQELYFNLRFLSLGISGSLRRLRLARLDPPTSSRPLSASKHPSARLEFSLIPSRSLSASENLLRPLASSSRPPAASEASSSRPLAASEASSSRPTAASILSPASNSQPWGHRVLHGKTIWITYVLNLFETGQKILRFLHSWIRLKTQELHQNVFFQQNKSWNGAKSSHVQNGNFRISTEKI